MKKICVVLVFVMLILFAAIFSHSSQGGDAKAPSYLTSNLPMLVQTGIGDDGRQWALLRAGGEEWRFHEGDINGIGSELVYMQRVHHISDTDQSMNYVSVIFIWSA